MTLVAVLCASSYLISGPLFGLSSRVAASSAAALYVSDTDTRELNAQSVPLLQAAVNVDPNPAKGDGDIMIVDGMAMVAETGVGGTIVEAEHKAKAGAISLYEVREGDSLSQIADMFGVSVNTIKWANDLTGPIQAGDRLVILPISGLRYAVKKGDTLATIAKDHDADAREIAQFNGLEEGAKLASGSTIIIPNAEAGVSSSETKKPSKKATTKVATKAATGSKAVSSSGSFSNPVPGAILTQGVHGYNGVDLGAPAGTPIYASAGGTVIIAKASGWNGGYGNYVIVSHEGGVQTLYAHMTAVSVGVGEAVGQGDLLGTVGSTGKSTGNHLHFEVRGASNPMAK
jgi:LysM repeat protein